MSKFGPTRGELLFRLCFSVIGFVFAMVALFWRGMPSAPAVFEVGLIAGGFFGGTALWAVWKLTRGQN